MAEIEALCNEITIIRSGRLGYRGTLEELPAVVIKVSGTEPRKAVSSIEDSLPLVSSAASGSTVYLALAERVTADEVGSILGSKGVALRDVEAVQNLDERILAFL